MISSADQDYIKAIFRLEEAGGTVSTSSLAKTLGVTAASASGMLKKLGQAKLVTHRHYKGVRLTKKGRLSALNVLRRHRLIELFLVKILEMPWESVHAEAEKLEHAVSDEVLSRIDKLLGFPEYDPHGSPIPSPKSELESVDKIGLDELNIGEMGTICEVRDDNPEMLRYLSKIGLIPGVKVEVHEILKIDGTMILNYRKKKQSVSRKVASAVWVDRQHSK